MFLRRGFVDVPQNEIIGFVSTSPSYLIFILSFGFKNTEVSSKSSQYGSGQTHVKLALGVPVILLLCVSNNGTCGIAFIRLLKKSFV